MQRVLSVIVYPSVFLSRPSDKSRANEGGVEEETGKKDKLEEREPERLVVKKHT